MGVFNNQLLFSGRAADDGIGATFARADFVKGEQVFRLDRQHIALLRFVRPDFLGRHALFFDLHLAQIKHRATVGTVDEFREGVRDAACADIVDRQDRILVAELPAAVDHFLCTTLDFRVTALHRIKVEVRRVGAGRHRRSCAAAHADQHARAANLDQQRAVRQIVLLDVNGADIAQTARDHDRLVIAATLTSHVFFKGAEVAGQVRTAKFVVERSRANRAFDHDVERGRDAIRLAVLRVFPRLHRAWQIQVGNGKARQTGFGLGTATGCAFVANFAAGTRRSARERRYRGRVVVRFHLHQDVGFLLVKGVLLAARLRVETLDFCAFDHRRVVRIGNDCAFGAGFVRFADHAEEAQIFFLAVDDEIGIENLVAAVLRIGLRKHGQFDVGRIAAELLIVFDQVVDFVVRERKAEFDIRLGQGLTAAGQNVHCQQRLGFEMLEQISSGIERIRYALDHAIVNQGQEHRQRRVIPVMTIDALDVNRHAALNAIHFFQAAMHCDIGGLGRPRRNGAGTWRNQQQLALRLSGPRWLAVRKDACEHILLVSFEGFRQFGEVPELGVKPGSNALRSQCCGDFFDAERGKRSAAAQFKHICHGIEPGCRENQTCHDTRIL